jgi:hypothetical protein
MPDLKLRQLLDALHADRYPDALRPFLPPDGPPPELEATRLQAPTCYWAVYRTGGGWITVKSFLSADAYRGYRASLERYHRDRVDRPDHPRGGITFAPDLNAVVWAFPFDPAMPELHRCVDGDWVARAWPRCRYAILIAEPVDYTPEIGAVVAYRDPERRRVVAYGKTSPKETAGLVYLVMDRLWRSGARREGRLRLAKPLAFRPDADFLLQTRVFGRPLEGDRNDLLFLRLARHAGEALATVHGADIPFGPTRGLDDLRRRLADSRDELALAAPTLVPTYRDLLDQIGQRAERSEPAPPVPSHGDFKYDQFLRYRQQFVLIDFELFCQAEPALDLGTFCAYLPPSRPFGWRDAAAAEALRTAFLRSYESAAGWLVNPERLALHESAMLALRALALVWRQRPDWQQRASQMLALAMERLVSAA